MSDPSQGPLRRVLIASANPLFARGLEKLTAQHWAGQNVQVRLASSMDEAAGMMETWNPELVIVDYDDRNIQRGTFLSHFIEGDRPMQVMLVSLKASGEVVVYDRRTLTPAEAENWLDMPWLPSPAEQAAAKSSMPPDARPVVRGEGAEISQSQTPRSGGMKSGGLRHYIIPGVLTILFTFVLAFALQSVGLLPQAASTQAGPVDSMISLQIWIISFLFSLITVFIVYSAIVYRRRPGDSGSGVYFKSSNRLEVLWTVIPLGTVIFLAFIGAQDLAEIRRPDANALEVKVTAFQWGWSFEYPNDGGVKSNQLYLPVNRQVHLVMTSRDVIHSFWVPEFRIKQDILPGDNLVKELRINPTRTGNFTVYCNQLCGGAHAYMTAPVKVVAPAEFDAWIASQSDTSSLTPEQRGEKLAQVNGCVGCHSLDGSTRPGPTWKGLAGAQVKLADGSTVTADDTYLHESIVDPNKHIVVGFAPGLMPQTYQKTLNDQQIKDIIAYIKTLK